MINKRKKMHSIGDFSLKGRRPTMEDVSVIDTISPLEDFPTTNRICDYFAVFDGHSGRETAQYMGENLKKSIESSSKIIKCKKTIIETAFMNIDEKWNVDNKTRWASKDSGCTAIVCIVSDSEIICANLGDSRCVLGRKSGFLNLSEDHKPNLPNEYDRIKNSGSFVQYNANAYRVNGLLAVARAFGDFDFKKKDGIVAKDQAVTAFPEVKIFERTSEDKFIVLACDGLWDIFSSQEVYSMVIKEIEKRQNASEIAEWLCRAAFSSGSSDNISCIIKIF